MNTTTSQQQEPRRANSQQSRKRKRAAAQAGLPLPADHERVLDLLRAPSTSTTTKFAHVADLPRSLKLRLALGLLETVCDDCDEHVCRKRLEKLVAEFGPRDAFWQQQLRRLVRCEYGAVDYEDIELMRRELDHHRYGSDFDHELDAVDGCVLDVYAYVARVLLEEHARRRRACTGREESARLVRESLVWSWQLLGEFADYEL